MINSKGGLSVFEGINHIVLFCKDTNASKDWYEKLGFEYIQGYEGMFWFAFNGMKVMLHPIEISNPGYTTIHVGVNDVHKVFDHVTKIELNPFDHQQPGVILTEPVKRPWGAIEFELVDPDGHKWAFTQN